MDEYVDVGTDLEVDETICIICGGSTYEGETISCETCLRWFHFQCVGVTHEDDCVRMEDVPYFCPSCAVKVLGEKGRKKPTSKSPRAQKRKPKPKKPAKPVKVKPEQPVKVKPEPAPDLVPSDGIKLKINLKNQPVKTPKPPKVAKAPKLRTEERRSFVEDLNLPDPNLSEESDSENDQPLIIDEIAPRAVKVGRRRLSQKQGGEDGFPREILTFGSELRQENLQALLQVGSVDDVDVVDLGLDMIEVEDEKDEEERWLAAVEEGNIEKVEQEDAELRSVRDPKSLTARQRSLMNDGLEVEDLYQALDFGSRKKTDVKEEDSKEKAIKAKKRRELETEKKEKIKKKTMDTLLKKKDSKTTKLLKSFKFQRDELPKISYVRNQSGSFLNFPPGAEFPMESRTEVSPPAKVYCCMCSNLKKYSCSKTGKPLCSLQCYGKNLSLRNSA